MIVLPAGSDGEVALWHTLLDLAQRTGDWTLIGARMVELHAAEAGRILLRTSLDGDVLADARSHPNDVRRVAQILLADDFKLEEPSYMGVGHAFVKGGVEIDLLAPEHLGPRSERARTTMQGARTVEVPGGRQALGRTERVAVRIAGREGVIPRPDLLGAILLKARAVEVDDVPENQRGDLALLLSLVLDPDELRQQLKGRERQWIGRRRELDDPDAAAWRGLARDAAQRGLAALGSSRDGEVSLSSASAQRLSSRKKLIAHHLSERRRLFADRSFGIERLPAVRFG